MNSKNVGKIRLIFSERLHMEHLWFFGPKTPQTNHFFANPSIHSLSCFVFRAFEVFVDMRYREVLLFNKEKLCHRPSPSERDSRVARLCLPQIPLKPTVERLVLLPRSLLQARAKLPRRGLRRRGASSPSSSSRFIRTRMPSKRLYLRSGRFLRSSLLRRSGTFALSSPRWPRASGASFVIAQHSGVWLRCAATSRLIRVPRPFFVCLSSNPYPTPKFPHPRWRLR